ncbi:hypothetical protein F441_20789, partial [Phytophthora nicotianae CJ01A1]
GCIRRILQKRDALRHWFAERIAKALRDDDRDIPIDFPLVNDTSSVERAFDAFQFNF